MRHKPTDGTEILQLRIPPRRFELHRQSHAIAMGKPQRFAFGILASDRTPSENANDARAPRSEHYAANFPAGVGELQQRVASVSPNLFHYSGRIFNCAGNLRGAPRNELAFSNLGLCWHHSETLPA